MSSLKRILIWIALVLIIVSMTGGFLYYFSREKPGEIPQVNVENEDITGIEAPDTDVFVGLEGNYQRYVKLYPSRADTLTGFLYEDGKLFFYGTLITVFEKQQKQHQLALEMCLPSYIKEHLVRRALDYGQTPPDIVCYEKPNRIVLDVNADSVYIDYSEDGVVVPVLQKGAISSEVMRLVGGYVVIELELKEPNMYMVKNVAKAGV